MYSQISKKTQANYRFRHWTRAKYAVFASLAVAVTIGVLSAGIVEMLLAKSSAPTVAFLQNNFSQSTENEQNEDVSLEQIAEIAVIEQSSDSTDAQNHKLFYINRKRLK